MRALLLDAVLAEKIARRSKVNPETPLVEGVHCREWQGALNDLFYGRLWNGVRLEYVHRIAWRITHGPIPEGKRVLHRCDNPRCNEDLHLWDGTARDNTQDMMAKGRHLEGRRRVSEALRGRPSPMRGNKHPSSILKSREEAIEIYHDTRMGTEIAKAYGISPSSVYAIKRGSQWGWATGNTSPPIPFVRKRVLVPGKLRGL